MIKATITQLTLCFTVLSSLGQQVSATSAALSPTDLSVVYAQALTAVESTSGATAGLNQTLTFAQPTPYSCMTDSVRRHFDFWVGEWDVMVNNQKVGENSITLAEGGCAIHESYTTSRNFSGQSINYYNPLDQKWHQLWVASTGSVLDYTEVEREDGMLQFIADFLNATGVETKSRLTFTANPDGTVRQLFENSADGGATWTPGFDGLYIRRD